MEVTFTLGIGTLRCSLAFILFLPLITRTQLQRLSILKVGLAHHWAFMETQWKMFKQSNNYQTSIQGILKKQHIFRRNENEMSFR
ncbi:MAG: hypothetical protein CMG85_17270 [Marinobacter sp.]|nr:hypothetical protein [Marinobacter sp.]